MYIHIITISYLMVLKQKYLYRGVETMNNIIFKSRTELVPFAQKVKKNIARKVFNEGKPVLVRTYTHYDEFIEEQIITKDFDFDTFEESLECTGYWFKKVEHSMPKFVQGKKEFYIS